MRKINRSNDKKSKKKDRLCIKSYGSNESKTENIDSGEFEVEKKVLLKEKLHVKNGKLHFWHFEYDLSLWLRVFEPCLCGRLKYNVLSTHSGKNNSWLNIFFLKHSWISAYFGSIKAYSSSIGRQFCSFLSVWKLKSDSWSFLETASRFIFPHQNPWKLNANNFQVKTQLKLSTRGNFFHHTPNKTWTTKIARTRKKISKRVRSGWY